MIKQVINKFVFEMLIGSEMKKLVSLQKRQKKH